MHLQELLSRLLRLPPPFALLPPSGSQVRSDGRRRLPALGPGTGMVPGQCTHTAPPPLPLQAPKRVLLAVDASPHSDLALAWCLDNALGPQVMSFRFWSCTVHSSQLGPYICTRTPGNVCVRLLKVEGGVYLGAIQRGRTNGWRYGCRCG